MKHIAAALLCSFPVVAEAACFGSGDPLFHCTVNQGRKALDVCLQGEVAIYRFGPVNGAAEMLLARHVTGVGMTPWNGIGRYLWEEATFYNGTHDYLISYSIDRNAAESAPQVQAGVIVAEGDSEVAEIGCDQGSVTEADFYPLFEAKLAAGQPWCQSTQSWNSACD